MQDATDERDDDIRCISLKFRWLAGKKKMKKNGKGWEWKLKISSWLSQSVCSFTM